MGKIVGWSEVPTEDGDAQHGTTGLQDSTQLSDLDEASVDVSDTLGSAEASWLDGAESVEDAGTVTGLQASKPAEIEIVEAGFVESEQSDRQPGTAVTQSQKIAFSIADIELFYHEEYEVYETYDNRRIFDHEHDKWINGKMSYYYDISEIDLHQVKFLVEAAERETGVDYLDLVTQVFALKQRVKTTKHGDWPDQLESPNLDELVAFLEEKYRSSHSADMPGYKSGE